jgi:hypothetical protein
MSRLRQRVEPRLGHLLCAGLVFALANAGTVNNGMDAAAR